MTGVKPNYVIIVDFPSTDDPPVATPTVMEACHDQVEASRALKWWRYQVGARAYPRELIAEVNDDEPTEHGSDPA